MLQLIFLVHYAGINDWVYLCMWLLIDRRDEFQLCKFITGYKRQQLIFSVRTPPLALPAHRRMWERVPSLDRASSRW